MGAPFNFPNAPANGEVYLGYVWDGEKWQVQGAAASGAVRYDIAQGLTEPQKTQGRVNVGIQQTTPLAASTNFNTITAPGTYYTVDASCTNVPTTPGSDYWYLEVEIYAPVGQGSVLQRAVSLQYGVSYTRIQVSGVWQPWWAILDTRQATKKNCVVNGSMQVSQENGAVAGTATNYYPVDQWYVSAASLTTATFKVEQTNSATTPAALPSPAGSPNRIRVTATAAQATVGSSNFFIAQNIEGSRISDLKWGTAQAKTAVFQLSVKGPAGTYTVSVWNSVFTVGASLTFTIAAGEANVDVVKQVVFPGFTTGVWRSDNGVGLNLSVWLMINSQTGNVFAALNNMFEMSDVSFTEGSVAPPHVVEDFASVLALCKRYWTSLGGTATSVLFQAYAAAATNAISTTWSLSTQMRAVPAITMEGTFIMGNVTSVTFYPDTNCFSVQLIATAGGSLSWYSTGSARLRINARMV